MTWCPWWPGNQTCLTRVTCCYNHDRHNVIIRVRRDAPTRNTVRRTSKTVSPFCNRFQQRLARHGFRNSQRDLRYRDHSKRICRLRGAADFTRPQGCYTRSFLGGARTHVKRYRIGKYLFRFCIRDCCFYCF